MQKIFITTLLFIISSVSVYANMTKSEVMELWNNDSEVIKYRQQLSDIIKQTNDLIGKYQQDKDAISNQNPWVSASALMTLTSSLSREFTEQLKTLNSKHALISYNLNLVSYKYQVLLDSIKAYSTYGTLEEYKDSEAVVTYIDANWFDKRSKITVYGCYSLENYVGWRIVLNLMEDAILNSGDYIIFGASNNTCDISYSNNYSLDFVATLSVPSCGKNSVPSNGKCLCVSWYTWEYPDIPNNYDCKLKNNTSINNVQSSANKKAQVRLAWYKNQYSYLSKSEQKKKYQSLALGLQRKLKNLKWENLSINQILLELINAEILKL